MGDVLRLVRSDGVGDGAVLDPDSVLEHARGEFQQVVVLGYNLDGDFEMRATFGSRETLWALRRAEHFLFHEAT